MKKALSNSEAAVKYAEELGVPVLTSQALADRLILSALCGRGFDEASLARAVDLEDPDVDVPIPFRGHSAAAQVLSWAGRLDEAHEHMQVLRRRCIDRGADSDMLFVAVWSALINVWRGNFADGVARLAAARLAQLPPGRAASSGTDRAGVCPNASRLGHRRSPRAS